MVVYLLAQEAPPGVMGHQSLPICSQACCNRTEQFKSSFPPVVDEAWGAISMHIANRKTEENSNSGETEVERHHIFMVHLTWWGWKKSHSLHCNPRLQKSSRMKGCCYDSKSRWEHFWQHTVKWWKAHHDNVAIKSNYRLVYGLWFSFHHNNRPLTALQISSRTQSLLLLGFVGLIIELLLYLPCFCEPLYC